MKAFNEAWVDQMLELYVNGFEARLLIDEV